MKKQIEQLDKLDQPLTVGDIVIVPDSTTTLEFARITKLTPKGARVNIFCKGRNWKTNEVTYYVVDKVKRANAIIKISTEDAMYLKLKGIINHG